MALGPAVARQPLRGTLAMQSTSPSCADPQQCISYFPVRHLSYAPIWNGRKWLKSRQPPLGPGKRCHTLGRAKDVVPGGPSLDFSQVMIFMMVNAIVFGIGLVTGLNDARAVAAPISLDQSPFVSPPLVWLIAPTMMQRSFRPGAYIVKSGTHARSPSGSRSDVLKGVGPPTECGSATGFDPSNGAESAASPRGGQSTDQSAWSRPEEPIGRRLRVSYSPARCSGRCMLSADA